MTLASEKHCQNSARTHPPTPDQRYELLTPLRAHQRQYQFYVKYRQTVYMKMYLHVMMFVK